MVRYVPAEQAQFVQQALDGYPLLKRPAEEYADEVIKHTRREQAKVFPKSKSKPAKRTGKPQSLRPKCGL